jgi:hypothetical protein
MISPIMSKTAKVCPKTTRNFKGQPININGHVESKATSKQPHLKASWTVQNRGLLWYFQPYDLVANLYVYMSIKSYTFIPYRLQDHKVQNWEKI